MTEFIPTWEQLNDQQLPAGTVSVFASLPDAITVGGEWILSRDGSITLTIAQWEAHGKKTRINRYRSIRKHKITPKNVHLIPALLQMVERGEVPWNLSEVK